MASTDEGADFMTVVPPKNDISMKYTLRENGRRYLTILLRSCLPAIIPQLLYLLALGELLWAFDPFFVESFCLNDEEVLPQKAPIASILRCEALRDYSGEATDSAGTIILASLAINTCLTSASYLFHTESIRVEPPWRRNHVWLVTLAASLVLITVYLSSALARGSMAALSWYFYLLFVVAPGICLWFSELVKKIDHKHEKRAVMMRRLQFETRLGMWSPKESSHPISLYEQRNSSPMV